jgi:transcriptional regulator with XRE-family HTH domain
MNQSSATFAEIGQKLKAARESRGLTLRQICERTKIPINHLQAVDEGNTEGLPEAVYVAGFIKRYAEIVGLDGYALSDEFKRAASQEATNGKNNGKNNGSGRYPQNQPVYVHPEYLNKARINTNPPTYKTWPFSFALIVLVLGVFTFLANQTNNNSIQQDPAVLSLRDSAQRSTATQTLQPGQTQQTMPATNTATDTAPGADGTKISLSANQHVWVEVKAVSSGESLYTGYLEQGDRRDFADSQGFRVRAGNGGSLSVDYKGKIETLGQAGKVTERAFVAAGSGTTAADTTATAAPTKTASPTTTMARAVRKPVSTKRSTPSYRSIEDAPRSIDSGTRSIDVPYRYDGRLDSD